LTLPVSTIKNVQTPLTRFLGWPANYRRSGYQ
jgi:hypothetical protein